MSVDYVAIGSIIIDDIIDPQGRSNMGTLGGGGSHAVAGMRVWSDNTGFVSVIGRDFPDTAMRHLAVLADMRGVVTRPAPQPRAWQLFEANGTRQEVFRTEFAALRQNTIQPREYPPDFASAKGVYLQTATPEEAEAWAVHLKKLNPKVVLLWEPWEILYTPENLAGFRRVAPMFDIVSPQTVEVSWMIKETGPARQADILFECGARCLALRLGAGGSLVGQEGTIEHIPALPVPVVDETGAGNAYCGGFVVGYVESGGDPLTAGRYGAVSATFTLAQVGIPRLGPEPRLVAEARLREMQKHQ